MNVDYDMGLASYICVEAQMNPGIKIVVTGPSFRDAKYVGEAIDLIFSDVENRLTLFSQAEDGYSIRKEVDRWSIKIGDSDITIMPLCSGDKVRGRRADRIVFVHHADMNQKFLEEVVCGHVAISKDPVENTKRTAQLKELGLEEPKHIYHYSKMFGALIV